MTDYRPVPLTEYIKLKTMVYNEKGEPLRSVGKDQPRAAMQPLDTDLLGERTSYNLQLHDLQ